MIQVLPEIEVEGSLETKRNVDLKEIGSDQDFGSTDVENMLNWENDQGVVLIFLLKDMLFILYWASNMNILFSRSLLFPIAKMNSITVIIDLIVIQWWQMDQLDVKNKFLNGDMEGSLYGYI